MTTSSKIGIGVVTSVNLKERYNACRETWIKDFENVFLFGGNGCDDSLINIMEAGEDYYSHFIKQQLGLKYMYEHNKSYDWYCMTSCDAILFKEVTIRELSRYDHNTDIILGQPCGLWSMNPIQEVYSVDDDGRTFRAIAGGGGFFISNSLMSKCYQVIDEFNLHWSNVSHRFYPFSDVAISYMIYKYFNLKLTNLFYLFSQPPIYYESIIDSGDENKYYEDCGISLSEIMKTPMSFHYIKPQQMRDIYIKYNKKI